MEERGHMGQFFDQLVGDEARIAQLDARLSGSVNDAHSLGADPYLALSSELNYRLEVASGQIHDISPYQRRQLSVNANFGMTLCIGALKDIGRTFADHATVPQTADHVGRMTNKTLLPLYTIAHKNREAGWVNLASYVYGTSPKNPISMHISRARLLKETFKVAERRSGYIEPGRRAFVGSVDGDGQVAIRPRRKGLVTKGSDVKCPATLVRVGAENSQKPALWALMKLVTGVAVHEIYPHYFPITAVEV
jgi:hypothetical protein